MKLEKLYSLRKDFTIIGLTGRVGSGCSEISKKLSDPHFNKNLSQTIIKTSIDADELKYKICANYLSENKNWSPFKTIIYKDVLLLHLFHESIVIGGDLNKSIQCIIDFVFQNGENGTNVGFTNRFDIKIDSGFRLELISFLEKDIDWYNKFNLFGCTNLLGCLKGLRNDQQFFDFYFDFFEPFSKSFYQFLNNNNITKRTRLCHDLANNLRDFGTVENLEHLKLKKSERIVNIYCVAETINEIIKIWKYKNPINKTKIIIDSLKNSLELMYFKEKYSAFYMIATKKNEVERKEYILNKLKANYSSSYSKEELIKHNKEILILDNYEYDASDVNDGEFSEPDTENCIQKSDFHIFFSDLQNGKNEKGKPDKNINYKYLSLERQLVTFISLLHQPGIITPTSIERSMQIAYNAKFNSGCISRQVGALVTDKKFTVKAIGWNDVPQNQIPCNLRSIDDLKNNNNKEHFSSFEKGEVDDFQLYKDDKKFKEKIIDATNGIVKKDLEGKNCSFCFKTYHNAFEGEKNQVHTRSLHAEENAMLQISKYGGQGLLGGNLFTTASPCELCSKKAFQLGIENIYYIDPYPGISSNHILNNGVNNEVNPNLIMFQGAVGKTFHKLYEPFLAYKDELSILTELSPKVSQSQKIEKLTKDKSLQDKIKEVIKNHNTN